MAATKSAGAKKEVEELLRAVRANGYSTVPSGGGHKKVVDKHGRPVVDKDGPLIISSSPSDVRWRDMHVKRLMRAGVLKEDPWNPQEEERKGNGRGDEHERARIAGQIRAQAMREHRTAKIRRRIEPIIVHLGGWDKTGFTPGLGRVMYAFAKAKGRVEAPASEVSAIQNARQLKVGATLSDKNATCWELLLDDLEKAHADDGIAGLQLRYVELTRLAKNLGTPGFKLEPESAPEPEEGTVHELVAVRPAHPLELKLPTMAMEIVARMGRGAQNEGDLERILVLGERVARLEMEGS